MEIINKEFKVMVKSYSPNWGVESMNTGEKFNKEMEYI